MIDAGLISKCNTGMYALLPLGYRILEKLTAIIDNELLKIDAQKILLPALSSSKLWAKTNRLEEAGRELFSLQDKHNVDYILSPVSCFYESRKLFFRIHFYFSEEIFQ